MRLKAGRDDAAKITLRASGPNMNFPALPLGVPVRVQLQAANGECWETLYPTATVNDGARFISRADWWRLQSSRANQSDTTGSAGPESV